jgi:hypothetical protein
MNIKQAAASFAALTILAGVPAFALADTSAQSNPIVVNGVHLDPSEHGTGPGSVSVNFQNTSKATATEVIFALDVDGTQIDTFTDEGSFAPGVTIKHTFDTTSVASAAQVKVSEVKFADGSTWASGD